ncbi:MAG: rRNA methyltransferase [Sphingomonas sp. 12-62-6]|nr:MAG: rRNA methyltransferase [Sphingomonas sp. 12-62-6]
MSFYAYMLRCADGSFYVGHTDNLEQRIAQHQHGEIVGYTQGRRPVELVWSEYFQTRLEALEVERQIKGWTRRKKQALIDSDWATLHDAAIPPSERALRLRSGRTGVVESSSVQNPTQNDVGSSTVRAERSRNTSADRAPPPVIVLVRPQLGENIGKAARAMLNFGLVELRLVSPRDGWPNPSAGPAAILFGPERAGLETDDVALARTIITVPINPEFGSLNLAQAVILVAYEWSKGVALASPPTTDLPEPAPQEELEGMIQQMDVMLDRAGFYFPPDRTPVTRRTLRTLLTKPGWSSQEVRTMRGVLSALDKPRDRS